MARRRRPPRSGALTELSPLKILGQIAVLQGLYYVVALLLMVFTALVAGTSFSMDMVFGWADVRGDTTQGWVLGFVWVLDGGLFMAIAIVILIARSKLVLDFALSLHGIHLAVVTLYTGKLPRTVAWWLAMAAASAVAIVLGTRGCQYRELKPISFGGSGAVVGAVAAGDGGDSSSRNDGYDGGPVADGDEEQGFSRGRGRGRGRDGGGEYEMVKMNGDR